METVINLRKNQIASGKELNRSDKLVDLGKNHSIIIGIKFSCYIKKSKNKKNLATIPLKNKTKCPTE
ncbi:Uncharacterised protein [Proteus mirabilis]|uniref:hypothetical protein n=1 Tax=Proteus mirabilis TaxID=584 RepID=UPI000E07D08B|nr:hypothetical protein [Proteus mirabilis]SUC18011.1 Uncharacterised protein [Proteus mirabilis]